MKACALWMGILVAMCAVPARASFVNYSSREINVKIVYYGAASAPKLASLEYIYGKTDPSAKGKLISLTTALDRVVFFDLLPLNLGEIRGFKLRFHLYTVPGHARSDASRRLVLKGVDGVVFVVDGDSAQNQATLESWEELKHNLAEQGYDLRSIPLTVQLTVSAKPRGTRLAVADVQRLLGLTGQPVIDADVSTDLGVLDALKSIAKAILEQLRSSTSSKPEPPPAK